MAMLERTDVGRSFKAVGKLLTETAQINHYPNRVLCSYLFNSSEKFDSNFELTNLVSIACVQMGIGISTFFPRHSVKMVSN